MKTLLITLLSLTLSVGASAQRHGGGHVMRGGSRIFVVPSVSFYGGWGLGYPFGYYGYPLGYFGYPYWGAYGYRSARANALDQKINSIKTEYKYKIKAVRRDKTITRPERRQEILTLKSEREGDIQKAQNQFFNKRLNAPLKSESGTEPDSSGSTS